MYKLNLYLYSHSIYESINLYDENVINNLLNVDGFFISHRIQIWVIIVFRYSMSNYIAQVIKNVSKNRLEFDFHIFTVISRKIVIITK